MKVVFKISLAVLLGLFPLLARCEISDNDLRKLFIITGASGDEKYGGVVLFKSHFDKNKTACAYKKSHPETTIFIDQEGGRLLPMPFAYKLTHNLVKGAEAIFRL